MIITFTAERTRKGIGKEISRKITPGTHKIDHRPLAALIYDYMEKQGYINQKEAPQ